MIIMSKKLFIKTKDKETAQRLRSEGFQCVNESSGVFTFINDSRMTFSNDEMENVVYDNKLNI